MTNRASAHLSSADIAEITARAERHQRGTTPPATALPVLLEICRLLDEDLPRVLREMQVRVGEVEALKWQVAELTAARDEVTADRDRLAAQVQRVRAVHLRELDVQGFPVCGLCDDGYQSPTPWPCLTMAILDGGEAS